MYALCDVNSMYASCEKVFDPSIRNKPVIVLTNNDGCICAACGIAKRMGIGKKFVPYFQVKNELAAAGAIIRSSNYELYADLSQRMMDTCARFAPHFHIYSIDECFLYYGANYLPPEGWNAHAALIRRTVWKEVRLPIGVGVGSTPTLAKAANHASKRIDGYRGVAVIDNEHIRKHILMHMDVTDVWGIGRRLGKRLNDVGINTAWQLSKAKPGFIRKEFSILVENTVHELNGIPKLNWDEVRSPKQQIFSTRSFGQRVTDKSELRHALISHVTIAASKLRRQNSLVKTLQIFACSSPHDNDSYYRQSILHTFPAPTSDTSIIAHAVSTLVDSVYRQGVKFYKCGVGLIELVDAAHYQQDLFNVLHDKTDLMHCIDRINSRYGRNTVHVAAQGTIQSTMQGATQKFAMRREFLSPQYTTRLTDIPKIFCD